MSSPDLEADCAQNIGLLYYLGQNPSDPHENEIQRQEPGATGWTISLSDEKHLTSTLGFLSAIRDDINNVTAVCVEERSSGMVVMVAANAIEAGLSSPYLPSVKVGLDNVFSLLRDALYSPREQLASDVLRAIVSMCRWRILSRIRMINPGEKEPFEKSLRDIGTVMKRLLPSDDKKSFLALSKQLESKLADYRGAFTHPSSDDWAPTEDKELESVIQICHKLYEMRHASELLLGKLKSKRPCPVQPSSCDAVLNMIRKVGNYRRAATKLVKLARQYECIRKATTLIVELDSSAFVQRTPTELPSFRDMLCRLKARHGTGWEADRVKKGITIRGGIDRLMNQPRVHAEMQLIWYLDQHTGSTPPRVIASNKDACYLCNAFITFHGKYSIPRTHGRLYPGWRLPSSGLQDVKRSFSLELERVAVDKINQILKKGWKGPRYPPESNVSSAVMSGVSILTELLEALEGMAEYSDSDETVVPEHGTGAVGPGEQQTEVFQGSPTGQDDSGRREEVTPSCSEVESSTDSGPSPRPSLIPLPRSSPRGSPRGSPSPRPEAIPSPRPSLISLPRSSSRPSSPPRPSPSPKISPKSLSKPLSRPLLLPRPLSGHSSIKELQQAQADEYVDDDKSPTPKTQASQSSEKLHHSTLGADMGNNSSVRSRLSRIVSPETYGTRLSSMSTSASLDKESCEENKVGDKDAWRQVEEGRQEVMTLSDSLELFVEYTTVPPHTSQHLRFKARRLSEEELAAALHEGVLVHDLASLGYEEVKVESSGGVMMRVGDQVFVAHVDEFVAPTHATGFVCK